jgi:hypothetical protein
MPSANERRRGITVGRVPADRVSVGLMAIADADADAHGAGSVLVLAEWSPR